MKNIKAQNGAPSQIQTPSARSGHSLIGFRWSAISPDLRKQVDDICSEFGLTRDYVIGECILKAGPKLMEEANIRPKNIQNSTVGQPAVNADTDGKTAREFSAWLDAMPLEIDPFEYYVHGTVELGLELTTWVRLKARSVQSGVPVEEIMREILTQHFDDKDSTLP